MWSKYYTAPAQFVYIIPNDIVDDGNSVIVAGQYFVTDASQYRWGFISRINKSDGNVTLARNYHINNERFYFNTINKVSDGFVLSAINLDRNGISYLIKINSAGEVLKAREFTSYAPGGGVLVTSNGEILRSGNYRNRGDSRFAMHKLDTAWNVVWAKTHNLNPAFYGSAFYAGNGSIFVLGNVTNNSIGTLTTIARFTGDGELITCPSDTFMLSHSAPTIIVNSFAHQNMLPVVFNNNIVNPGTVNPQFVLRSTTCEGIAGACDTVKINGPDTACNLIDTFQFTLLRDSTCTTAAQWSIDTAFGRVIAYTDTTIDIRFKKIGAVYLYAQISTPCRTLKDSILIHIFNPQHSLNLGPDLQLCKISVITLNAGLL